MQVNFETAFSAIEADNDPANYDHKAAVAQGWAVWATDGGPQVQRLDLREDGEPELDSDDDAIALAREMGLDIDDDGFVREEVS